MNEVFLDHLQKKLRKLNGSRIIIYVHSDGKYRDLEIGLRAGNKRRLKCIVRTEYGKTGIAINSIHSIYSLDNDFEPSFSIDMADPDSFTQAIEAINSFLFT